MSRAQNQVQTVANGSATAAVDLTPTTSCVFDWSIDNPNVGLAPTGTGTIPSFTAINNTHNPITATITVTPKPAPARAYIPSQATGMVSVLDVATNTVIAKVRVGARPYGVAISPDNSKVYVTNNADNTVSIIDAVTNTVTRTFPVGSDPRGIVVGLDGKKIYVACHGDTGATEYDVYNTDLNLITVIPITARKPIALAISPDGERVYTLSDNSGINFPIKTIDNTIDPTFHSLLPGTDIRINSRANKLYGAGMYSDVYFSGSSITYHPTGTVYNFNTQSFSYINTPGGSPACLTTSPDGDLAYFTIPDANKVSVVNTAVTVLDNTIPFHPQINSIIVGTNPQGIATTPDGFIYVLNYGSNNISVLSPDRVNPMVVKTISTGDDKPFALGDFITHDACTSAPFTVKITINPTPSAILTSGTPQTLTTPANIPCPSTSFNVTGVNLYDGIQVIAPDNFEISEDNVNFSSSFLLGAGGDIPATPIYVRLKGNIPVGNYAGNITLQSTNVTDVLVPVSGEVTTAIPNITTTPATGNITACLGTASSSPHIQRFAVSGELLVDDITATAPTEFEVSLFVDHGYGNSVIIPRSGNDAITNVTVYVRSSAAASGIINGNVTLTSAGAYNRTTAVYGEIDVPPTINNNIIHQTLNAGNTTTAINFSGSADSFIWHNDTPGIGLPQDGSGNINPFIATNTTGQTLTANITVTPVNAPLAYITNQNLNTVSVINTFNNQVSGNSIPVGEVPYATAVSPDGSRVYVANQNSNTISVINTLTNTVISTIRTGNNPSGIAISPDGSKLYVTSSSTGLVFVIYTTPNSGINTSIIVGNLPLGIVASPDGNWVYVANRNSNTVSVISTAINAPVKTIPVGTSPEIVALSPDGGTLYVTNYNSRSVAVINTQTYQTSSIAVGNFPRGIAVSPDGDKVYVANWGAGTVSVIDVISHSITATVNVGQGPEGISVTPDGKSVYVANTNSSSISVISTLTNTVTATIPLPGQPVSFGNFITPLTGCAGTPVTFQITVNPPVSVITASGILPALNTTYGIPSTSASFSLSGSGLTEGITVTPPGGFEVSTDDITFTPTVVVGAAGNVSSVRIYIRLASTTAVGNYSGDILFRSTGAPDASLATTSSTVNPAPLTIKADDKTKEFKTANPVLTATYTGFVNNEGVEQLTTLPDISTTANDDSPAGQYPITVSGAAALNYTFNYVAGILTVTAIEVPLVIPNTFTPNNDGINDTWVIKNLDTYQKYTVQIFNRNGESLFFSNRYSQPWDGKYKGAKLPAGTYYYVIDLHTGSKPLAGSITIIR